MIRIDELAEAALAGDALRLRSLSHDWLRQHERVAESPPPESEDETVRSVAAGLAELFAERLGQPAPTWAAEIGASHAPVFLLKSAARMSRLRVLCERESPWPLRRRNLFAPPTYLEFA